ncbi:MAG: tyrosine-type recombinase/integrase [Eubacteriales bacterium]|nr:tyrosine-type recombinase/integrase [Eubacteriales bacterium]
MALRSFASYCTEYDIANIAIQIDIGKVPFQKVVAKTVEYLSEDAIKTVMSMPVTSNYRGFRNSFFMVLMYDTAARCQEMLDIKIKDIVLNAESPYLYLKGKGTKTRPVPLMPKTVAHLNKYLEWFHPADMRSPDDYLFYTVIHSHRHQMSPDTVEKFVKKYGVTAREKNPSVPENVHPHQFRHTRAIHWYRSGIPLPLISDYLGHENLQTTLIYAYADTEMKRTALEKANALGTQIESAPPKWKTDEDMIKRLYALK